MKIKNHLVLCNKEESHKVKAHCGFEWSDYYEHDSLISIH